MQLAKALKGAITPVPSGVYWIPWVGVAGDLSDEAEIEQWKEQVFHCFGKVKDSQENDPYKIGMSEFEQRLSQCREFVDFQQVCTKVVECACEFKGIPHHGGENWRLYSETVRLVGN
jgi:hypothetical protein